MRFISMMGTAALAIASSASAEVRINEIRRDETGTDVNEYVELSGTPGESLAGLTLLAIGDGTSTTKSGVIEFKWTFLASDVIGPDGFLVLRSNSMALPVTGPSIPYAGLSGGIFENDDNVTFMLVSGYTGTMTQGTTTSSGTDLDTNDDGTLDVTPWTAIVDSVAMLGTVQPPAATDEWVYSANLCGPFLGRGQVWSVPSHLGFWAQNNNGITGQTNVFGFEVGELPQAPTTGTQTTARLNVGGGLLSDAVNNIYTWLESPTGTTTGSINNTSAGGSITVEGGPANANNGSWIQLELSMTGQTGLALQFACRRSATGFNAIQPSVSVDNGATFTDAGTPFTPSSSAWTVHQFNFGNSLDGNASVIIRLTLNGATGTDAAGTASTVSFDNILLSNIPAVQALQLTRSHVAHGYKQASGVWAIGSLTPALPATGTDTPGSANVQTPTFACGQEGAGDCAAAHNNAACADACCCAYVCNLDAFCCSVRWDSFCATAAAGCAANCSGTPCPADFDNDNIVSGSDLGLLLGGWGGVDFDLNADGIVNGADLGILLGAWGPCP